MRLEYPLYDPQCNIFENFQVNTRLQAKDNHRATWQVPLDQKETLPNKQYVSPRPKICTLNCQYGPFWKINIS